MQGLGRAGASLGCPGVVEAEGLSGQCYLGVLGSLTQGL
jgi:hypothetical protein